MKKQYDDFQKYHFTYSEIEETKDDKENYLERHTKKKKLFFIYKKYTPNLLVFLKENTDFSRSLF